MEKLFKKAEKKAEELTELLDQAIKFRPTGGDQRTALHHASETGNSMLVKLLIDRGAKIEAKNSAEQTPLHVASSSEVANYLIKR